MAFKIAENPAEMSVYSAVLQVIFRPRFISSKKSNPPEMANAPSSVSTATFLIDRTVKYHHFKHFNVRFFVSLNVFLCNSAEDLIKTSRSDDMQQFMVLVLI